MSCDLQNNLSVMVTPLDQLLLGINPRSGLSDHFISTARFVCDMCMFKSHKLTTLYTAFMKYLVSLLSPPPPPPPPHTHTHTHTHPSYMSLTGETPELALSAVNILLSSSHSVKVAKEMAVAISNNKVSMHDHFIENVNCAIV